MMFRRHKEGQPQSKHADENHHPRLQRELTDLGQKAVHRCPRRASLPRVTIARLRSFLYALARLLGDFQAVRHQQIFKRVLRRIAGRLSGRLLGKLFR